MSTKADYRAGVRVQGYDGQGDATLNEIIEEARRTLWRQRRWSWALAQDTSLVTTLGDPNVATTTVTDLGPIEGLQYVSGTTIYDLDWLELSDLRDRQTSEATTATGLPSHWTRVGAGLVLWPTPNGAYSLRIDYVRGWTALDDVSQDIIPDRDRDVVIWGAVVALAFRQREAWAMQYADQRYTALLRSALDNDAKQSRSESDQVKRYWAPTTDDSAWRF